MSGAYQALTIAYFDDVEELDASVAPRRGVNRTLPSARGAASSVKRGPRRATLLEPPDLIYIYNLETAVASTFSLGAYR
jgi:hypothetical protein